MNQIAYGFVGLGAMGGPMAANLIKAGHQVTVFDLFPAAVEALVAAGANSADSAAAAVTGAEFRDDPVQGWPKFFFQLRRGERQALRLDRDRR